MVGVTNLIEVRPKVAPRDVKQKILDALKRHAELEADAIRVDVTDGKVVLEGNVKGWYERGVAERAAWSTPGVKAVQDRSRDRLRSEFRRCSVRCTLRRFD